MSSDLLLLTVLNGLSLNTEILDLPAMTVSNGGKLEGDFSSKLKGDSGLAVNLKVTVTVSNGLSLST